MDRRHFLRALGCGGTIAAAVRGSGDQQAVVVGIAQTPGRAGPDLRPSRHELYVSPNGNDANDGVSWATAKYTILAAYDALPAEGGTIYFATDSTIGGEVPGQGLWIVGPNDINYNKPPAGWRKMKLGGFSLIGAGMTLHPANGNWPLARMVTGRYQAYQPATKPAIWLAGTNAPIHFENVFVDQCKRALNLGVSSAGENKHDTNTNSVTFFRCGFVPDDAAGAGPTIYVEYAYWIWFEHCLIHGPYKGSDADHRAAMLVKPVSPNGSSTQDFYIKNCNFNNTNIRYSSGQTGWQFFVSDCCFENLQHTLPGNKDAVDFVSITDTGRAIVHNIVNADQSSSACSECAVESFVDPATVVAINTHVVGPATVIGQSEEFTDDAETLAARGHAHGVVCPFPNQVGFTTNGRVVAVHDSARRTFGPVAVRFANRATQDVTQWARFDGTATVTIGKIAPDGTTAAAQLSAASGTQYKVVATTGTITPTVGDWFIAGVWAQAPSASGGRGATFNPLQLEIVGSGLGVSNGISASTWNTPSEEWQWLYGAFKVTLARGTNTVRLRLHCKAGLATNYYAPVFLYLPKGMATDNEVKEILTHLQSWSDGGKVGEVSTLETHVLAALGGLRSGKFVALKRIAPAYGATVAIKAMLGNEFDITVTDGNAFTIANPTSPLDGQRITLTVRNTSGRAMGPIRWGTAYKLAPWTNPAAGHSRSIDFRYDGTDWVEIARTPYDVPN